MLGNKKSIIEEFMKKEIDFSSGDDNSPRERDIFIYSNKYIIKAHPENFYEFNKIIKNLYYPFYILNNKVISIKSQDELNRFWNNIKYQIIYETQKDELLNEKLFLCMHDSITRLDLKGYTPWAQYYFKDNKNFIIHKEMLNMDIMNKFKDIIILDNNKYKIIDIKGIAGSGKSTLVYYFFRKRKLLYTKKDREEKIREIKLMQKNASLKKYYCGSHPIFNKYKKIKYNDNIKYEFFNTDNAVLIDSEINKESKSDFNDEININPKNMIDIEESNDIEQNKSNIYKDEFKNMSYDEPQYFVPSAYFNLDINFQDDKIIYLTEIMGLFKTYSFYMVLRSYLFFNENKISNVWNLIKYIILFLKENEYTLKRKVFIIIDQIKNEHINNLAEIEHLSNEIKDLFLVEVFCSNNKINFHENNPKILSIIGNDFSRFECEELKDYFGINALYSIKWASYENKDLDNFITTNKKIITNDIIEFFGNNKACISYINKKINRKLYKDEKSYLINIIPFKYFIIENNILKPGFKIIEDIFNEQTKNINFLEIFQNDDIFLSLEQFSKGDILEKIFKINLIKLAKQVFNNNIITIELGQILNKGIKEFLMDYEINDILYSNTEFSRILDNYSNSIFDQNAFIFTQKTNGKHYDICIVLNMNNNFILIVFQVTIHKQKEKIEKLKTFLYIDINIIQQKIELLLKKKITQIYAYLVFLKEMDNSRMIRDMGNNFNYLVIERKNNIVLNKDGKIFDLNNNDLGKNLLIEKEKEKSKECDIRNEYKKEYKILAQNFLKTNNIKYEKIIEKNYYSTSLLKDKCYLIFFKYEKIACLKYQFMNNIKFYSINKDNIMFKEEENFINKNNNSIRRIFLFEIII